MRIGYLMQKGEEIRNPPYNGPASHVRHVTQGLEKLGHEVRILFRLPGERLPGDRLPDARLSGDRFPGGGLWITDDLQEFRPVRVRRSDQGVLRAFERFIRRLQHDLRLPYLDLFESLRFALACRQELEDCDVFLERTSWMTYGGVLAARWQKIPLVLEYNGDPVADLAAKGELPEGVQYRLSTAIMGQVMRAADRVVATGDGWRQNCIDRWKVDEDRVAVVENGTSLLEHLQRRQLRSFADPETQAPGFTLVYLGGFYPWHGITVLVCALAKIASQVEGLRLVLIGSGAGEAEARELVHSLGLSARIDFLGQLTAQEYAPLLAAADIGLSPYCGWPEYSGLKLFDYKAAGLAVIASGEDGKPATLRHGVTGWVVPPCDEDALAEAILRLCADPELRRSMGRQARIDAETAHSWEHTARRLEQVLVEVCA
jgi:glycosyltransferase involved in cell wall biosynthesis